MNCRECSEHLYEYLDRELTPQVKREIRAHIADCPPCGEHFDFERVFLTFLRAPSRPQGAPPDLKRRILRKLFDEGAGSPRAASTRQSRTGRPLPRVSIA